VATRWRQAQECARATGVGALIAERGMAEPGDRRMGIKGDRRRELASNSHEWLRGRGAKETGPCPRRDPLARSCQGYRGLVGGASGVGEEDDTVMACGRRVGSGSSDSKRAEGARAWATCWAVC